MLILLSLLQEIGNATDLTVSNMGGKNPERVFGLGDYSYDDTGSCWWNKLTPSIDSVMKIAIGNHEDDSSEGFSGYMSHFGLSQTYYKYDYEGVHVLVMDTDRNSYASGSAQRNFVQNDLQAASTDPNVKWIIVYLHKPMYTSPNSCSSSSCSNTGSEITNIRNGFGAMFDQYGVDGPADGCAGSRCPFSVLLFHEGKRSHAGIVWASA